VPALPRAAGLPGAAGAALLALASTPAPSPAQAPDSVIPLPPVLVVSFPLPTELAGAPAAVSVIDGRAAARAAAGTGFRELLGSTPGLQADDRHNDALDDRLSIRGFGARAQFGVRGLAVLVDGIPATMPDGQTALSHLDPASVRRVEVVRGPASTFAGNAGGGALRIQTAPDAPTLQARVLAGPDGLLRLETGAARAVGGALVAGSLSRRRTDGYRTHADADRTWTSAHADIPVGDGRLRVDAHGVDYEARNPGSLTDSAFRADPRAAFARNVEQGTGETGSQAQAGLRWLGDVAGRDAEAGVWALTRTIENPIPTVIVDLDRRAWGARLRYRGRSGPLAWAAGVDGAWQSDDRLNFANEGGSAGARVLDQRERVAAFAPLAQASVDAGRARLSFAARWDAVRFDVLDRASATTTGDRTLSAFSPALGAVWRAGPRVHAFANVSTAFETPTAAEFANDPQGGGFNGALKPQRTAGFEAGARGAHGAALRWEAVAHHARVRDALVPFEGDEGRTFFRNAGRTRHAGVEVGAAVNGSGMTARASYAWTRVDFRRFRTDGTDLRGKAVPGVTPHAVDAALATVRSGVFAELAVRYRSRTATDDANTSFRSAYAVADLRVEAPPLHLAGAALALQLGVRNLTGERYAGSIVPNAFGARYFEPAPGRLVYVGLDVTGRRAGRAPVGGG
jgi:iron complex outermembrane receptor protein